MLERKHVKVKSDVAPKVYVDAETSGGFPAEPAAITRVTVPAPRCEVEARARLALIIPTIARRFGHPMAGTPLTPALCPSLMKASTVGENRRSCQAVSTSEAAMPKRSAIGTMTSRFEISACSVKNARETSWQKAPASPSPFWARTSSAVSSAKREFTLRRGGRLEVRLLELNARASREPVATPPAKTASVHLRAAYPDESRKEANSWLIRPESLL